MRTLAKQLEAHLVPFIGDEGDYEELLSLADNKRFVLIGEATHGTHEFYQIRAEITKRLIAQHDFTAVAVEADWPDAYRVNRYVRGDTEIDDASDALGDFKRFPTWMWRNTEVSNFVDWLYDYNHNTENKVTKAGFYGLDLYSLNSSVEAVIEYLDKIDPDAAARARVRYGCFENYDNDPHIYGRFAASSMDESCEREIIAQLKELQQQRYNYLQMDGANAGEEFFSAEQNARLVAGAESYYRAMFLGRPSSWNIRDTHMTDTLDELAGYLTKKNGKPAKIVVWAHNSHIGDASATDSGQRGEINIGMLTRQRHPEDTLLIGFSTYSGTVTAAHEWDEPPHNMNINDALPDSFEHLFHKLDMNDFVINLHEPDIKRILSRPRLSRFIGVLYRPMTERWSHYFKVDLPNQFDAVIHIDKTHALTPLEPGRHWLHSAHEMADTYPSGL